MSPGPMTVLPGRIPYTAETEGHLVVLPSGELAGGELHVEAACGESKIIDGAAVEGGRKTALAFALDLLPEGGGDVSVRLLAAGEQVAVAAVRFDRFPPRDNEVKIDHVGRGLIVDGLPFLPFGFYCDDDVDRMSLQLIDEEVCQGFNMMMPYHGRPEDQQARDKIRSYMDRCAEVGMKVIYAVYWCYWPRERVMDDAAWAEYRAEVESVRDHPALLAYYLADEPGLTKVPEKLLDRAYRTVKEADPYHPVMLVHMDPKHARNKYKSCLDIVMADPYPIPDAKITRPGDWVDQLRAHFPDQQPIWIAPQAFGGVYWWQREPTGREQRVMTYLALIHGATGIQYFLNRPRPTKGYVSPNSPVLWNQCRTLALEAAELTPALLSGEAAPALASKPRTIRAGAWADHGVVTILAANTRNRPARVQLQLEGCDFSGEAHVLFENRTVKVTGGRIREMIDAFGTRAYQLAVDPVPVEDLSIDPANLVANPSFEDIPNPGTPAGCCTTAGSGPGSTYFVDSRLARHGRHCLRLCAPAGEKVGIVPVRFALKNGRAYRVSIWAKADRKGARFTLGLDHVQPDRQQFELTTDWQRFEMTGRASEDREAAEPFLQITGPAAAWFDVFQTVELTNEKDDA